MNKGWKCEIKWIRKELCCLLYPLQLLKLKDLFTYSEVGPTCSSSIVGHFSDWMCH